MEQQQKKKNPNNLEIPWWCPDEPQTKLGIHFHPHPPFLNYLAKSIPSLTDNIMGSAFPLMSVCPSTFCSYNKMPEVAFFFFLNQAYLGPWSQISQSVVIWSRCVAACETIRQRLPLTL